MVNLSPPLFSHSFFLSFFLRFCSLHLPCSVPTTWLQVQSHGVLSSQQLCLSQPACFTWLSLGKKLPHNPKLQKIPNPTNPTDKSYDLAYTQVKTPLHSPIFTIFYFFLFNIYFHGFKLWLQMQSRCNYCNCEKLWKSYGQYDLKYYYGAIVKDIATLILQL